LRQLNNHNAILINYVNLSIVKHIPSDMSSQLRRIEATLAQLNQKRQDYKFQDLKTPHVGTSVSTSPPQSSYHDVPVFAFKQESVNSAPKSRTSLSLPTFQTGTPPVVPNRYSVNPALPMNLLKDIEGKIVQWQNSLQQLQRQIQAIYREGPLLDAWLESHEQIFQGNGQTRKADSDHLMNYVEELSRQNISYQSPRPGYRLCGIDDTGQMWSQPCPPDQVIEVSMAIARYQKLQQLLAEKKKVEARLNQLAEGLVILHSNLQTD
jgi:uncharacterized protein YukE